MHPRMPLPKNGSPIGRQQLIEEYARQAVRLREFAASATTTRIKARLLEEAAGQERLAEKARQGGGLNAI